MAFLKSFGAFWYDFLIGDRPELFIGSVVALFVVWLGLLMGLKPVIGGLVLLLFVLVVGGVSLWWAVRPKR